MNKRSYRRFTTDEKRMILTEVQQPGVTLSEVCRKHSVSPALVYRWRAVAQQATTQALQKIDSRGKTQPDAQTARQQGTHPPNYILPAQSPPADVSSPPRELLRPGCFPLPWQ